MLEAATSILLLTISSMLIYFMIDYVKEQKEYRRRLK